MNENDIKTAALEYHKNYKGKIEIRIKSPMENRSDLSLAYTPGVGAVASAIAADSTLSYTYTNRSNSVAVISNGTAVLGLGNIGVYGAYPVMEGKSALFKRFGGIDAVPICVDETNPERFIAIVQSLANNFGAINLEDIAAPNCFHIETELQRTLDIPVMHDDQWGTAIVVLAGVINALRVVGKSSDVRIVLSGAGSAGIAIAKLLLHNGMNNIVLVDSQGVVIKNRSNITVEKSYIVDHSSATPVQGDLLTALTGSDVFIGVSKAGILHSEHIAVMNTDPIVFALANPVPEIMPDLAHAAGARVVATGRSDFPNQINNALVFPKLFRYVLDTDTPFSMDLYARAAHNLAATIKNPTADMILPGIFDEYELF